MMVIFGRNITMGTCVFRPVCSLSPITPMVGSRIVMPVYHRQRTHKFVSWSLLRWLFTLLLYANMFAFEFCCFSCTMSALSVSAASYHVVVKELIEGNRMRLVKLRGYYSNIGFSEAWILFLDYWTQHCSCRCPGDHVAKGIGCCNVGVYIRVRVTKFL